MKRYIALFMSVLLIFLTIPASFALETTTSMKLLFSDDFEKGTLGDELTGWTQGRNGGGITHKYAIDPKNSENQVLCFDRTSVQSSSMYNEKGISLAAVSSNAQEYQADIIMDFRFFFADDGASPSLTIRHRQSGTAITEFYLYPEYAQVYNPTNSKWIFDYDAVKSNQWNTLRLLLAYDGRCSLWVNEEIVSGDNGAAENMKLSFVPSENGGIDSLYLNLGTAVGKMYVDDVHIYSDFTSELEAAAASLSYDEISNGQYKESVRENLNLITELLYAGKIYPVSWESSDENFIKPDGTVSRKSFPRDVILTAKVYKDEEKDSYTEAKFDVTVLENEGASDYTKILEYAQMYIFEEAFTTEDKNTITKNLTSLSEGLAGIEVSWSSSEGDIISAEGVVTRPAHNDVRVTDGKAEVSLTAVLTLNDETLSKTITYSVQAKPDPRIILDEAMGKVTYTLLTEEERTRITKDLYLPQKGENDTLIEWSMSEEGIIAPDGTVTRGNEKRDVTLTATFTYDGVSDTKSFNFTVLPSEEKMIEEDIAAINTTGWDALTQSFTLPQSGKFYETEFTWTSENSAIVINGERATVYRPLYDEADVTFNLTLTAVKDAAQSTKSYSVTVLKDVSDTEIINEALGKITFAQISEETIDAITKNLSLPTLLDNGVTVTWESSDEEVVTPVGEVIRPSKEKGAKEVTLTATVKRNYIEQEAEPITFTVLAYETDAEVIEDAKNSLLFSRLTDEPLEEVTSNLYLPSQWRSCSVEWTSSDENFITVSGTEGIVTRPEWGVSSAVVTLGAKLTYAGLSRVKSFHVRILEKDYMELTKTQFNEDFEAWTEEKQETEGVMWNRSTEKAKTYPGNDPINSENQVFVFDRSDNSESGTAYILCESKTELSGIVYMSLDVFLDSDTYKGLLVEARSATHTQISVGLEKSTVTTSGYLLNVPEGTIKLNEWNHLVIEANVAKKKYHLYLNEVHLTENGKVTLSDGTAFNSSEGLLYVNYADDSIAATMKMFRFHIGKNQIALLDNLNMTQKFVYTETQLNLADKWEREFMAANNIDAITGDLNLPDIWQEGHVISYETGNSSVIDATGRFTLSGGEKDVVWTLMITDDATTYKKSYNLHAVKTDKIVLTDSDAVAADVLWAVNNFKENYMLTNLDKDMAFPSKGENGSSITVTSSDVLVISNSGIITRGTSDKTVILTIKAARNGSEKTETLSVTVAKKETVIPSTTPSDYSGGGGGGVKVTKGEQTKADTGVEIQQPDEENNENSVFTDISKNHWAYDAIKYLVDRGIVNGMGDGSVHPERTILREEFVKLLVLAMELSTGVSNSTFTDVKESDWFAPYIAAAKESGILNGYADGRAGIGEEISREDMAVMIFRAAELLGVKTENEFADSEAISDYAKDAVYTLQESGVINGRNDGTFAPKTKATRAETAAMLYKAIKKGLFD